MSKGPFLIVGGGIGGLALAIALAQQGRQIQILERSARFEPVGAGVQLSPNATRALASLGLLKAVTEKGFCPQALEMRDGKTGALLAREPVGQTFSDRYGTPYLQIHRADLHAILQNAAMEAGVALRLGVSVAEVEQVSGRVIVHPREGTPMEAAALIGADGLGSAVRTALFGAEKPRFTGQVAWRALVPLNAMPPDLIAPVAGAWLGDRQHFVHYVLRDRTIANLVGVTEAQHPGPEAWDVEGARTDLIAAFDGWAPPVRALVNATSNVHRWPLFDRAPMPSWGRGLVTLLGDACHPMLPFLAQGAGMALEDAVVLAAAVQAAPTDIPGAFSRYARARQGRTQRVQAASRRNAMLFHLPGLPSRVALGAALSLGGLVAPGRLSLRQDWLYGYDATSVIAA